MSNVRPHRMHTKARPDYATKTIAEIVDALSIGVYEPPLSGLRENLSRLPDVLRVPILVIDLDTELAMNGILGFLENSTGLYLSETIEALVLISAHETSETLRTIARIVESHGVSPENLRAAVNQAQPYAVTSFTELHGEAAGRMASEVTEKAAELYLYNAANGERVFDLLCTYLEPRRNELLEALRAA
jgi:hypothetical protein